MQYDANLVLYDGGNRPHWYIFSWGRSYGVYTVEVYNDGNVVVYDNNGNALWATGPPNYQGTGVGWTSPVNGTLAVPAAGVYHPIRIEVRLPGPAD